MTLQDCLNYCLEQNGLDHCKNCGLDEEVIQQAKKDFAKELVEKLREISYDDGIRVVNLDDAQSLIKQEGGL